MAVNEESPPSEAREEVERLAQEFVERKRRGEKPSIEEYMTAHPRLADEIRDLFQTLLIVEDLGASATSSAAAASPAESSPGIQEVGEYRILREIGRGGMGVVYEAEQASLGRRVALKVLPLHSLLDQKRLERFQQEARAAARLSHPNIVPVYGVGEHLGIHYYAMQYIPGQGLNRVLEEVRRLREAGISESDSADASSSSSLAAGLDSRGGRGSRERYYRNMARLARDAALALDYAHGEGILHRDVKPSNLLLDTGGRVWLTDFGLAKAEGSADLTHSGDFVGTILYMAPERFKGWSDPRSDVYGLGITLYELITLRPAFQQRDRAQLLRKVASEEPPAPRRIDRAIPRDLETIVLKAIAKEPAQRYDGARAIAEDLERFLEGLPVKARRSHPLGRLGRWCGRNPLPASLAAAVLCLLILIATISSAAAVRLAGEQAERAEQLRSAYLSEAVALRASARPGRRLDALEALGKAAAIRRGPDLVDAAIASFAELDLRRVKHLKKGKNDIYNFSPDGRLAAMAEVTGEVRVSEVDGERQLYTLPAPGFPLAYSWPQFSRSGKLLAVRHDGVSRREWKVWDLDRRLVLVQMGNASAENCMDFSPGNRWVVLGTNGNWVRIFDLDTGEPTADVGRGSAQIRLVSIHPGGRLLAYSDEISGQVHVYDREEGRVIRRLPGTGSQRFYGLEWHPDGRSLAAASNDHLVHVWNALTGERLRTLQGHWAEVQGVGFHPLGYFLASWGWDPAVRFWSPGSDRPLCTIYQKEGHFTGSNTVFWTANDESIDVWELAWPLPAFTLFGHEGLATKQPHCIALAPGGAIAATGGDDGVRLWDLRGRRELAHLPDGKVLSVIFDPAGTDLYTAGFDGLRRRSLRLDLQGNSLVLGPPRRLVDLDNWQRASLGANGTLLAAVQDSSTAWILDTRKPENARVFKGLPGDWRVALSPDGSRLAAGSTLSEEVWVWNVADGQVIRKVPGARARPLFHPSGSLLALCTPAAVTLVGVEDGAVVWSIERDQNLNFSGTITFDREGHLAAFTQSDSRIWIVEARTGRKLSELEAAEPIQVTGLALEGGVLGASTVGRRFHVWDLNGLGREIARLGLTWVVPAAGAPLGDGPPIRAAVVEPSIDLLDGERISADSEDIIRPRRAVAFLPRLETFADIDGALASRQILITAGETWRFRRGRAEPSRGLEWTGEDFDESGWESGRSPVTSWEAEAGSSSASLSDQAGNYTSVYLRRAVDITDPSAVSHLVLAVDLEDGLVAYWNGEEIGRTNAGGPGEPLSYKSVAKRTDVTRVMERFEVPADRIRPGRNTIALHVLSYALHSRVYASPILYAVHTTTNRDQDRKLTENLLLDARGRPEASLLAYREGRICQRAGEVTLALSHFERACEGDSVFAEPYLRRIACHRALGEFARTESLARDAIEKNVILDAGRLWGTWLRASLVDLRRTPAELLGSFPRDPGPELASASRVYRRLLEELAAKRRVRINCGGGEVQGPEGEVWLADCFSMGGNPMEKGRPPGRKIGAPRTDSPPEGTERWFPGNSPPRDAYAIPVPPGRCRVSLHFTEWVHHTPLNRVSDIVIEGKVVLEGHEPLQAGYGVKDVRSFEVEVVDGKLDLSFVAHEGVPLLTDIEIEILDDKTP